MRECLGFFNDKSIYCKHTCAEGEQCVKITEKEDRPTTHELWVWYKRSKKV